MKNILILGEDLYKIKFFTNATYLMILTAKSNNHNIYWLKDNEISIQNNQVMGKIRQLEVLNDLDNINQFEDWFKVISYENMSLNDFDLIIVRSDPPVNSEYLYNTHYLSLVDKKVKIINSPESLRNLNEKLAIFHFPQFTPPSMVTRDKSQIFEFLAQHKKCVIKPLDLMAGNGVFILDINDINHNSIIQSVMANNPSVMIQEFIERITDGDKRIFIIDGEVFEYILVRLPAPNDFRVNSLYALSHTPRLITTKELAISQVVGAWCKNNDIFFAGIDMIGDYLTEINITSPSGIMQIYRSCNVNIAELLFKKLNYIHE